MPDADSFRAAYFHTCNGMIGSGTVLSLEYATGNALKLACKLVPM